MLNIYFKELADEAFQLIETPKKGSWIHVDNATEKDLEEIAKLIDIDKSDMNDCLDKYEIPRVDRIKESILIYTRHPSSQEAGLYSATFSIILTNDYFITICPNSSHLVQNLLKLNPPIAPHMHAQFLTYLLLKITQEYTLQIKKIRSKVLNQEKKMTSVQSRDITTLTFNEEILNQYLSSLAPLRNVLQAITSGKYTVLLEKDQDLLEDLLNASIQSEELCSSNLRSIRSLRDSYQIIFTNQLNKTIKLLTALTIILSIPTMIASLYGMNVKLPIQNSPQAFNVIMLGIFATSFLGLYIFHRKKWL